LTTGVRAAVLLAGAALAVVLAAPRLAAAPDAQAAVERIVFAAGGDLWLVPPTGGTSKRLTRTRARDSEPALSPDGSRLAFVRDGRLVVARADGSGASRVAGVGAGAISPSWSPDGRLAYEQDGRLAVVEPGGAPRRLDLPGTAGDPAWSPDGARIAFSAADGSGNVDVHVLTVANGQALRVTDHPAADDAPAWSPDGSRLAFVSARDGNPEVYVVGSGGGEPTRVTTTPAAEASPDWSPDGTRLVFERDGRLVIAALDGSSTRSLGPGQAPDWGRWLAPEPGDRDELLPDLDPRAPTDLSVAGKGGRWFLGFDSAVDNVGLGPMWLRGRRPSRSTPLMDATQRVRLTSGRVRVYQRVGKMRYTFSPTHIHWHMLDFMRYELRRAADFRLVGRDYKTGFCLGDHYGHAADRVRVARAFFLGNCGQGSPDLLAVEQGNSVGYTDRYPSYYHGQQVEVTRVPAGVYVLVHRANPTRRLRETKLGNNAASVRIRVSRARGRPSVHVLRMCEGSERCPAR
jgi:hypothetical protein